MLKTLLILSFLAFSFEGFAQTAPEFFHRGAQFYVFGEKQKAMDEVVAGLTLYPTNQPLNDLAALLKKEEEQEQQQQGQNENQSQDANNNEQNPGQQQQQNEPTPDQQEQKNQQQPDGAEEKPEGQQQQEQMTYAPGQMTPEQAERLLDAQKGQEMLLPVKPEQRGDRQKSLKDW